MLKFIIPSYLLLIIVSILLVKCNNDDETINKSAIDNDSSSESLLANLRKIIDDKNEALERRLNFNELKLKDFFYYRYFLLLKKSKKLDAKERNGFLIRLTTLNARIVLQQAALAKVTVKNLKVNVFENYFKFMENKLINNKNVDNNEKNNKSDLFDDPMTNFKRDIDLLTALTEQQARCHLLEHMKVYFNDATGVCVQISGIKTRQKELLDFRIYFARRFGKIIEFMKLNEQSINEKLELISTQSKQTLYNILNIKSKSLKPETVSQQVEVYIDESGFAPIIAGYLYQTSAYLKLPSEVKQEQQQQENDEFKSFNDFAQSPDFWYVRTLLDFNEQFKHHKLGVELLNYDFLKLKDLTENEFEFQKFEQEYEQELRQNKLKEKLSNNNNNNDDDDDVIDDYDDDISSIKKFRLATLDSLKRIERVRNKIALVVISCIKRLKSPNLLAEFSQFGTQKSSRVSILAKIASAHLMRESLKLNALSRLIQIFENTLEAKNPFNKIALPFAQETMITVPFNSKSVFALVSSLLQNFLMASAFDLKRFHSLNEQLADDVTDAERKFFSPITSYKRKNIQVKPKAPEAASLFDMFNQLVELEITHKPILEHHYAVSVESKRQAYDESDYCALNDYAYRKVMSHYLGINSNIRLQFQFGFDILQLRILRQTLGESKIARERLDNIALTVHLWRLIDAPLLSSEQKWI